MNALQNREIALREKLSALPLEKKKVLLDELETTKNLAIEHIILSAMQGEDRKKLDEYFASGKKDLFAFGIQYVPNFTERYEKYLAVIVEKFMEDVMNTSL